MPRWLFLLYEYFFELAIVVLLGVFASTLIELYIKKVKRFFPKNQLLAFIYGAILPVCSCGAIPLIETMKQRVSLRVIITFVIAAPLLNPYIIILSISIFGIKYCLLRVVSSFALAILTGFLVDFYAKRTNQSILGSFEACKTDCYPSDRDPFVKALRLTITLLPYILIGGVLSFGIELVNPKNFLSWFNFSNQWLSMLIMAAIGIPIYVCNGADIILLKPLLSFTDLSLGSSMVFSLTSSVICVSSIVMLTKFLGRRLTVILVVCVTVLSLLIGSIINLAV
jgi:uncharacterized membrane protein YraQ (UPF0718 family)